MMTYLKKPRWIDREDEDRPFPALFRPTREELDHAEPVQFSGKDEFCEYAADLHLLAGESDSTEDRVIIAKADPLLDEPEWGTAPSRHELNKKKDSIQLQLETED
jgi:hypothetical protein